MLGMPGRRGYHECITGMHSLQDGVSGTGRSLYPARSSSRCFFAILLSLAIIFAAVARAYLRRYNIETSAALGIYAAFMVLLALSLAPAWQSSRLKQIAARYQPLLFFLLVWCSPYFLYAASTGD